MAKWEVDPEDIAKLIAIYEEGVRSGQITNTGFADWVQKRLSDELRKRGRKLTSALEDQQKKIAEIVAERLRRLVASLMPKLSQAMKQTLGEERYRQLGELPAKDTLPKPEPKKDDKTKTASKEDKLLRRDRGGVEGPRVRATRKTERGARHRRQGWLRRRDRGLRRLLRAASGLRALRRTATLRV